MLRSWPVLPCRVERRSMWARIRREKGIGGNRETFTVRGVFMFLAAAGAAPPLAGLSRWSDREPLFAYLLGHKRLVVAMNHVGTVACLSGHTRGIVRYRQAVGTER